MNATLRLARIRVLASVALLSFLGVVVQQAGVRAREVDRLEGECLEAAERLELLSTAPSLRAVQDETRLVETDLGRLEAVVPLEFDESVERREMEHAGASRGVEVLFSQSRLLREGGFRKCEHRVFLLGGDQAFSSLLTDFDRKARIRTWKREEQRPGVLGGTLTTYARATRVELPPPPAFRAERLWLWPYTAEIRNLESKARISRRELAEKRELAEAIDRLESLNEELRSLVAFIQTKKEPASEEAGESEGRTR